MKRRQVMLMVMTITLATVAAIFTKIIFGSDGVAFVFGLLTLIIGIIGLFYVPERGFHGDTYKGDRENLPPQGDFQSVGIFEPLGEENLES